jgi:hypothetical protein
MSNITPKLLTLAIATVISGGAAAVVPGNIASTNAGPTYIGSRSANPEQETFAYRMTSTSVQILAFVGPARNIGIVTGDAEKDTVAYQAMLTTPSS